MNERGATTGAGPDRLVGFTIPRCHARGRVVRLGPVLDRILAKHGYTKPVNYPDFSTKWMELLKETIPRLSKLVVIRDPASPSPQLKGVETAAKWLDVPVEILTPKAGPTAL